MRLFYKFWIVDTAATMVQRTSAVHCVDFLRKCKELEYSCICILKPRNRFEKLHFFLIRNHIQILLKVYDFLIFFKV